MELAERISGCLLGGAAGDALGGPVEFASLAEIRRRYGPDGVTEPGRPARFTDDTQLALFTVEGLIRASVRGRSKGICHPPSVVRHAYLRWLHTQGVGWPGAGAEFAAGRPEPDGWLVREPIMHHRMAPGNTCLAALHAGGRGTVANPVNDSKGCGAVMRAAPAGFFCRTAARAWETGCEIAAITHGHRDGIYPAGVAAAAVRLLADGLPLPAALADAATYAPSRSGTAAALAAAFELATSVAPSPELLAGRLGGGWTGDEALAIAVCCALSAADPAAAVLAAVNHSGDSDSTGTITGHLLGAAAGLAWIPAGWLAALDGKDVIERLAADAATELLDPPQDDDGDVPAAWWDRYPGW
jgi:ADP-ribosylglycohydrolase